MFTKTAAFYDLIYHWKDYPAEADKLAAFIQQHKRSSGSTLLDVGCGTGKHLEHLRTRYTCEGIDLDPELLRIARERLPDLPLHRADVRRHTGVAELPGQRALTLRDAGERPVEPGEGGVDGHHPRAGGHLLGGRQPGRQRGDVGVDQRLDVLAGGEREVAEVGTDRSAAQVRHWNCFGMGER